MRRVKDLVDGMYRFNMDNFDTSNFESYGPFNCLIRLFREDWFSDELKPCEYFATCDYCKRDFCDFLNAEVDDYE